MTRAILCSIALLVGCDDPNGPYKFQIGDRVIITLLEKDGIITNRYGGYTKYYKVRYVDNKQELVEIELTQSELTEAEPKVRMQP